MIINNPLISIIIPVYNAKEYLRRCLDSILRQNYTNIEVLLIDDGSSDGSEAICDEYALLDKRIKVIHQKNTGVSAARNVGLDLAKGDYISFVDSDDWIENDLLETLLNISKESGSYIVVSNYTRNNKTSNKTNKDSYTNIIGDEILIKTFLHECNLLSV